jgi:Mor family transcriptional regulator
LGEKNVGAKIRNMNEANQIREKYVSGKCSISLASEYSVSRGCIQKIVENRSWYNPNYIRPSEEFRKKMWYEQRSGEKSSGAITTRENVVKIRNEYGEGITQPKLAQKYGVSRGCICNIVMNKTWYDPDYIRVFHLRNLK